MSDHDRLLAPFDLHQLVYAFVLTLALAFICAGLGLMLSRGRRLPRPGGVGMLGGLLAAGGSALVVMLAMATVGPWREPPPRPVPVRVLDLQQPISEAERDALRRPNP